MRLLWAELRVLVKTVLKHSFGHRFKHNINQSRSVWTKAQICLEDLLTSENTSKFSVFGWNPNLLGFGHLYKNSAAPVGHLSWTALLDSVLWQHLNSSVLQPCRKKITVIIVLGFVHALTGGVCRGAVCFLPPPWLEEENALKVFQS